MTQSIPHIQKGQTGDEDIIVTDAQIEEILPKEEEFEFSVKHLSEVEAEEAIGGDIPVEGVTNFNIEDEEAEKEADII